MNKFNKLFFIIPTYDYFPKRAISEIARLFYDANIIIINDNPTLHINESDKYTKVDNPKNLGLARTLYISYQKALSMGAETIVKIDPDLEYPIQSINPIFEDINLNKIDVGFVHFYRKIRDVSLIDYLFHKIFGRLESLFIGDKLSQHSPGLQVYKATFLEKILDKYKMEVASKNLIWGGDLLLLKIAKDLGGRVKGYEIKRSWQEKRKLIKIFRQGINTVQIITGYRGIK